MIELRVYGRPAPQGSKERRGHGAVVESSKCVKPWRSDVRDAAEQVVLYDYPSGERALAPGYPLHGPLVVSMVFTFVRPKGHYRTGRNAHLLRDSVPARPHGTPDLSKLARSTEDALTSAGVWEDDARVVEYARLAKVWASEDPEALGAPGAVIRIWRLDELAACTHGGDCPVHPDAGGLHNYDPKGTT
ncbi:RusA family crossover junction endodeoxyribonuclease [Micromonospora chalcea]|uniref:RusA family crossover junction endodeoxyribonuclease n=1 Tax=Micromonospora chalcea TaxID=1874 RepID=UPI0021A2B0B4|nr:RusA family crossover junction endodeoxyribonuclease [Micromonospora chalcea]MCT2280591.1 RusA family crossover junction endodeoxyribonuclease [Micromonospora chalcea]